MGDIEMVRKEVAKMLRAQGVKNVKVEPTYTTDRLPNTRNIGEENKKPKKK